MEFSVYIHAFMDENRSRINGKQTKTPQRFRLRPLVFSHHRLGRARALARGVTFDGGWFWIASWRFESSPELLGGGRSAVGGRLQSEVDGRGFG